MNVFSSKMAVETIIDYEGAGVPPVKNVRAIDHLYLWGTIAKSLSIIIIDFVKNLIREVADNIKEYTTSAPQIRKIQHVMGQYLEQRYPAEEKQADTHTNYRKLGM